MPSQTAVALVSQFVGDDLPALPITTAETRRSRLVDGANFILEQPAEVPTLWGDAAAGRVLWAAGESLIIAGPSGVGKSTLSGQLVLARLGLLPSVLGMPVAPSRRRVLYIAADRPPQIARSFGRMVDESARATLADRLRVWRGPPPADLGKHPETLIEMAHDAGADTVVVDSLKDVAVKLTDDEVGATYNRARQLALVEGVELLELHHQVKHAANGGKPDTLAHVYGSTWITAGAGSVVLLWGTAGDAVVELLHLKQPADTVGPLSILHDSHAGRSTVFHEVDPLALVTARPGLTASELAHELLRGADRKPKANEVEKARRLLDGLVRRNLARRTDAAPGGVGGGTAARYYPANSLPGVDL